MDKIAIYLQSAENRYSSVLRGASAKKIKQFLDERIDEIPDHKASTLVNATFAADLFFVILTVLFFTGRIEEFEITLFFVPIITYVVLESPGFRLRMLEKPTWVAFVDILCAAGIVLLCIETDKVLCEGAVNDVLYAALYLAVIVVLMEFICRNKWAYYLMIPVSFVFGSALALRYIPQYEVLALTVGAILAISMVMSYQSHAFYFGIGRDDRVLELVAEGRWGNESAMRKVFSEDEMRAMLFTKEKKAPISKE